MARRPRVGDPEAIRKELLAGLEDFGARLDADDLRARVRALIPASHLLRDLGVSAVRELGAKAARDRILAYLQEFPCTVIAGDELGIVSGISEYARRIRELRVEAGWPIYSGKTARAMAREEDWLDIDRSDLASEIAAMGPDDYILLGERDEGSARRWEVANEVRRLGGGARDRLLEYLRRNVGRPVTGEELGYVGNAQSWPRRVRELRTEFGWPIATRISGRPDLTVGVYLLEADRQSPPHDRHIADPIRVAVLERDGFACRKCGWRPARRAPGDLRTLLELHHIEHHAKGGANEMDNLLTLCNVHHDELHRLPELDGGALDRWLERG